MKKNEPERYRLSFNICKAKHDSGKSARQIADELGVYHGTVNAWLNGKSVPNVVVLVKYCRVVGITLDDVLKGVFVEENNTCDSAVCPDCNWLPYDNPELGRSDGDQTSEGSET